MSLSLRLMVGLPRGGKTTRAREYDVPIVNPDSIRRAIHGQRFFGPAEPLVWAIARLMVDALHLAGHNAIIVDATHVSKKRRAQWQEWFPNAAVSYDVVNTPPDVCIERALAMNDHEIVPVIERMAKEWDLPGYWKDSL